MKKTASVTDAATPRATVNQLDADGRAEDQPAQISKPAEVADTPPIFLSAKEAAALLRISPVTLSRWRIEGRGPAYRKFSRRVVYARDELVGWAEAQRRQSTSAAAPDHRRRSDVPA